MLSRFIFLFSLIAVGIAHSLQTNEFDNPVENAINFTEKNFPTDSGKAVTLYRQKRGWAGLLFKGVSILTKVTSLGLTLSATLTEGCSYYRSICDDKKETERLDELIKKNTRLYETEYFKVKKSYLDLKTAQRKNGYISYYINQSMQIVETIQDIEDKLSLMLQIKLPRIAAASKKTTVVRHLEQVEDKLEYRLSDLQEILLKNKQNALIDMLVPFVIETTLSRFADEFQNAYTLVSNAEDILRSTKKLKLVPKVFKQMAQNFKKSFVNLKKSVLKWGRIKNWKGFKGKLMHNLKSPLARLQKIKKFFSRKTNAKFAKGYKMSWSEGIMTGIGIIGDIISQVASAKEWAKTAKEMRKARENYKDYNRKLNEELKEIVIQKKEIDKMWNDEIEIFRKISLTYKSSVIDSSRYSKLSDIIGLSKRPVYMNTPLFLVNFYKITKESLGSSQTAILDFLKEVDYNFTVIKDEFRAHEILYSNTLTKSQQKEPVHEILSYISSILEFSHSTTMRRFASQVKERDLVCTISILRYDITEYDFFPLEPFRPRCEVNSSIFDVWASQATSKRKSKLMLEIVTNSVKTGTVDSFSKLVDSVHMGVAGKTIATFGRSVTEQDIICMISEKFPSRDTYDFISLKHFRPNCSSVNADRLKALMQDASKQRQLAKGIKSDLQTCQELKFCPCLKSLAEMKYQSTEADVTRAIKQLTPAWKENREALFCGPSCNSCVHL